MKYRTGFYALVLTFAFSFSAFAAVKIGYINSQKILSSNKDAQEAQRKFNEINAEWEKEGLEIQKQMQKLGEELDSQSLLLSEERKREKQQEIQNLYAKLEQFKNEKWGPKGEAEIKNQELMAPVLEKINAMIKTVGEEDKYDYILDTASGNILYAKDERNDLTERVIEKFKEAEEKKKKEQKKKQEQEKKQESEKNTKNDKNKGSK